MKVHVKILGMLEQTMGRRRFEFDLAPGATVRELLVGLKYTENHRGHILAAVNAQLRTHDQVLAEGDQVELSIPIGGG